MRHLTFLTLLICGAMLLVFSTTYAQDGDKEEDQYFGMRVCFACHNDVGASHLTSAHVLTLQPGSESSILGDSSQDSDVLSISFPGEGVARLVTQDDIAFIIGTGRFIQRYVAALESGSTTRYMVLPFQWNTVTQSWEAYIAADTWPDPAYDFATNCAGCHTTGLNMDTGNWIDDGVQCEACHGPGAAHIAAFKDAADRESPETLDALRTSITLSPDSQICGQCHSQGTSPDNLPFPTEFLPGDDLLAAGTFRLAAPDDEAHWWASGHASSKYMQFNESLLNKHESALDGLRTSEHAQDECLACHSADYNYTQSLIAQHADGTRLGNAPDPLTVETAEFGVTCSSCHSIHVLPDAEGSAESSVLTFTEAEATYALCTTCHQDTDVTGILHHPVREMFEGETLLPEVEGSASPHFIAENGPTCTTCHMPSVPTDGGPRSSHTFAPVFPGEALNIEGLQDTCSTCHASQVNAAGLQAFIDDIQTGTQARIDAARGAAGDNNPPWVKSALDFVESDGSLGIHNYTYADALLDAVEIELGLTGEAAPIAPEEANRESPDTDDAEMSDTGTPGSEPSQPIDQTVTDQPEATIVPEETEASQQ